MALPYFGHKGLKLDVLGMPEFIQGIERAKILQIRFMRGAFKRGGKQVRKAFIRDQLSGPPGIKGGELKKGKNVFSRVYGDSPSSIGVKVGISRILHVHEKGMTITAKGSGKLYLHAKGRGPIVAVTDKVVIPSRLRFRKQAESMGPAIVLKAANEAKRATELVLSAALKSVARKL